MEDNSQKKYTQWLSHNHGKAIPNTKYQGGKLC